MSCELKAILSSKTLTVELQGTFAGSGECADGTVNIVNSEDTLLYSKDVASGETAEQLVADQTAEGTTGLGAIFFPAGTTGTIPDVEYTDTDGSPATAPYGSVIACSTPADGTVEIKNSADTLLYTVEVGSGDTEEQVIPDQSAQGTTGQGAITFPANTTGTIPDVDYTDSDGSSQSAPYGTSIVCSPSKDLDEYTAQELEDGLTETQRNAVSRVSLFKLGTPTVSYYNNDLGDNNPGRGVDFFTLSVNNPNGNTNRFELLGTDVVIDWAYRKYWTKNIQATTIWNTHNDNSEALTLEGLTTWRLPSVIEYLTIMNTFDGDPLNHSPFNIVNAFQFLATSETSLSNTSNYYTIVLVNSSRGYTISTAYNKTVNGASALYCKDF